MCADQICPRWTGPGQAHEGGEPCDRDDEIRQTLAESIRRQIC